MKKLIGVATLGLALGLAVPQMVCAESETTTTTKKTTTSPSGNMVIENETTRSFKIQGDPKVYVAPPDVDLKSYSGKDVTVSVDSNGKVTRVERKTVTTP